MKKQIYLKYMIKQLCVSSLNTAVILLLATVDLINRLKNHYNIEVIVVYAIMAIIMIILFVEFTAMYIRTIKEYEEINHE